uniref:Uncharacterized protein n=1 Tax=Plectus sambesii TaxID=2011161 RepID=A0A914WSL4_9BILA
MPNYSALLLFFAAIIPGVVGAFEDSLPIIFIALFFVVFFGILCAIFCAMFNSCCNPNSSHQRMMRLEERAMEAQIRHIENAPPGTVLPIYDFRGGRMRNQMLGNSRLMIDPDMPLQQMAVHPMSTGVDPMTTPDLGMPPVYSVAVKSPNDV